MYKKNILNQPCRRKLRHLFLTLELVEPLELVVNLDKIEGVITEVLDIALGFEVLLEVSLLTEVKSSFVAFGRNGRTVVKQLLKTSSSNKLGVVTSNLDRVETGRKTTTVREHGNLLTNEALRGEGETGDKRKINTSGVDVTDVGGGVQTGGETGLGLILGQVNE